MKGLIERLGRGVKGVLTGFDRIVFKGHILPLMHAEGAMSFLRWRGVLNKDYKRWVVERSEALIGAVDRYARERCGQGVQHRNSWREDKEALANARQKASGVTSGLIGAWSFLESGRSYRAHYDAEAGYPQLRPYTRAHKHLYVYLDHEDYGRMNLRIQTWFPYAIQIALNGRQWLRRSLEKEQVDVVMEGNKCLEVADYDLAQEYLDEQLDRRWPALLNGLLPIGFPTLRETVGPHLDYYWTLWQSEWASDIVMESPADLKGTMDALVRHAVLTGTSTRVLRYMGRPITASGRPHAKLRHEVSTRVLDFHEGVRVRHWVDQNSVKIYNEYNVLRSEMTMNRPGMFRVYRRAQGEPASVPKQRRALRKGVADIPLRAKVSDEILDRFTEGVATFSDQTPLRDVLGPHARASTRAGRPGVARSHRRSRLCGVRHHQPCPSGSPCPYPVGRPSNRASALRPNYSPPATAPRSPSDPQGPQPTPLSTHPQGPTPRHGAQRHARRFHSTTYGDGRVNLLVFVRCCERLRR
jgi:hypothetical protein